MAGQWRLKGGAPRMLGRAGHGGERGRWYREAWEALVGEFGELDGLRRLEAGRVAVQWVQVRESAERLEAIRQRRETGRGRRPSEADVERVRRQAGKEDKSYAGALAEFREAYGRAGRSLRSLAGGAP